MYKMDINLIIKIVVFILLALFASWPYFEKFKEYHLLKRLWIGVSILCLLGFGIMDINGSDVQAKKDKKEISKETETISKLSIQITQLTDRFQEIKDNNDNRFDDLNGRFDDLNDRITLSLQENKGNISASLRDTSKNESLPQKSHE